MCFLCLLGIVRLAISILDSRYGVLESLSIDPSFVIMSGDNATSASLDSFE